MFPKASQPSLVSAHPAGGVQFVASSRSQQDLQRLLAEYETKYGTVSGNRVENFRRHVALVDSHPTNSPLRSGSQLSPLAVLSREEFESTYRGCAKTDSSVQTAFRLSAEDVSQTPASIDWRNAGAVTP